MKYYVTNLPFGCTPWEVAEFLGFSGEIAGTYVARKNDKAGNRFGFVSFKNLKNAKELEQRMNGVKMGKFILKINIAKFASENAGFFEDEGISKTNNRKENIGKEHSNMENNHQKWPGGNDRVFQKEGLSFAELFKGKGKDVGSSAPSNEFPKGKTISIQEDVNALHFLHGSALIGRSVDINILNKMDRILWEEGFVGVAIHYVGGLSLLLSFKDHEAAGEFLGKQEIWKKWFSTLDLWEGQSLAFERVAWLNVMGVPLHLADYSVYNEMLGNLGWW
ncbi:putative RNA recognition motif domain, nucleotide-binding alpha-beta plait domain superfamily [Helianthus annuus]|nr:putative RNA recognition motif domain, nucleotide-binding alpha-beta plait domain superfamily [Helianthus annuus]KAJ0577932.1 putative RNA recognition motif domain, nucleotide-binding alpha-beta plait domain superfamily [Helianthus annuus]KAJ0747884.1 putative RNA recognition motif domain, nucleotide-binding alpha-beta plait domain superfamily [Helianthus annuus]